MSHMKTFKILIVEDEAAIRDMVRFALEDSEFILIEAEDVVEARKKIFNASPDLILLDWMLPGMSGINFVIQLKREPLTKEIPIILLTAKAEEDNKIKGLDAGADDYVTKPFSPRELVSRIKTVLRRGSAVSPDGIIQLKKLFLNTNTHQLIIDGDVVELAPIEYKLLYFFLTHQNRIYSREQLLTYIWKEKNEVNDRTVDVQIRRLRDRLKLKGYNKYIQTIYGAGYQFVSEL